MLTVRVVAGRSTRFWGYVNHNRKDYDQAYQEAEKGSPPSTSHCFTPFLQGSGRPPYTTAPVDIIPHCDTVVKAVCLPPLLDRPGSGRAVGPAPQERKKGTAQVSEQYLFYVPLAVGAALGGFLLFDGLHGGLALLKYEDAHESGGHVGAGGVPRDQGRRQSGALLQVAGESGTVHLFLAVGALEGRAGEDGGEDQRLRRLGLARKELCHHLPVKAWRVEYAIWPASGTHAISGILH